eukprot:GHVS01055510.1.p1 GENE.GHVS01055510.1~~GHVS01055510.1.p1  ORF type:complete len:106 (+),score=10.54 GHVS01055510.1:429-746(+)
MWELNQEHMATLDAQEGVHLGVYRKMRVQVWPRNCSTPVEVLTYQHTNETFSLPSKVYKEVIVTGAKEHVLPAVYVDFLERLGDNGYDGGRLWTAALRLTTSQTG